MKLSYTITFLISALFALPTCGQEATHDDFKTFCAGHLGRWVGEVTSVINESKLGEIGNTHTVYWKTRLTEDGNLMILSGMGGTNSVISLTYFDAAEKQIRSTGVNSEGVITQHMIHREGGNWIRITDYTAPDGTTSKLESVITMPTDGKTLTVVINGKVGERVVKAQTNVWHRISN